MTDLAVLDRRIAPMTDPALALVRDFEAAIRSRPDLVVLLDTDHVIHGGMYARTVMIPQGVRIAGALIQVPTTLVVSGHASVFTGAGVEVLKGQHRVLAASAHRRQAFLAHEDTYLTMVLVTDAATVADAEEYFTPEADALSSRHPDAVNSVLMTGE